LAPPLQLKKAKMPIKRTLLIAKSNPGVTGGNKRMVENEDVALEKALAERKERSKRLLT